METEAPKDINAEIDAILAGMDLDEPRFAKAQDATPEKTTPTAPLDEKPEDEPKQVDEKPAARKPASRNTHDKLIAARAAKSNAKPAPAATPAPVAEPVCYNDSAEFMAAAKRLLEANGKLPPVEDETVEDEDTDAPIETATETQIETANDEPPKRWCELTDDEKIERKRAYAREYMKRRREAAKAGLPQTVKENPALRPNIARGETPRRATSVASLQRKCWELLLNGDADGALAIAKKWREEKTGD